MAKAKAKKATKNRVDQEVKPMDQDPLQKFDRLGEKDPRYSARNWTSACGKTTG
jgi:hypothetical protein